MREIRAKVFSNDYMVSSALISRCRARHIFTKSYFMKMDAQHFQVPQAKNKISDLQILLQVCVILNQEILGGGCGGGGY